MPSRIVRWPDGMVPSAIGAMLSTMLPFLLTRSISACSNALVRVVADADRVAPAGAADAVVGEPVRGLDAGRAAPLEVEDLAAVVEAVLVGGDDLLVPGDRAVVVVRQEVQPVRLGNGAQVEVLPEDVRLVAVDDLPAACRTTAGTRPACRAGRTASSGSDPTAPARTGSSR